MEEFPVIISNPKVISRSQFFAILAEMRKKSEQPYLITTVEVKHYNPAFGDNRVCECGHVYYRHFDSYEDNVACGCKYCACDCFQEKNSDLCDVMLLDKKN